MLRGLLADEALLFVGPSEAGLFLEHRFASAGIPMAFAFRKHAAGSRTRPSRLALVPALAPLPAPAKPAPSADGAESGLDAAMRLADQGRMAEAAALCEAEIAERGPSAQVLFLMGLIRSAHGLLEESADYYRKALFLDRHHREAMIHLAVLLEQQGDAAGAQLLRARARRAEHVSNR